MSYVHHTACYLYQKGDRPYNEGDRLEFIIGQLIKILSITGLAAGFGYLLGPPGAIIAGIIAYLSAATSAIEKAADEWLYHRLICLAKDSPKCAIGIVSYDPFRSDLGAFDNDQYIDVVPMPHPVEWETLEIDDDKFIAALLPSNRYEKDGQNTLVAKAFRKFVLDHPANDITKDGFQGFELLAPDTELEKDLGYAPLTSHQRTAVHCEAEGDFWIRMKQWAPVIAILLTAAAAGTVAAAGAGYTAGTAIGCAIGILFFGPLGCAIGALIGGLLGAAAGGAAGAALSKLLIDTVLGALFDADPGNIEDSNVGDHALEPIRVGDYVAVLGEHVYDGYHEGWHELHPLMAVIKFNTGTGPDKKPSTYIEWQPDENKPVAIPDKVDPTSPDLDDAAMRAGLNDHRFLERCKVLRAEWCRRLYEAFSPETRHTQKRLEHRWTIHPAVDGCTPESGPIH